MSDVAVILPAAGRSVRYGGGRDKLLELLDGVPVIARAVRAFLARADVGLVVLPTNQRERVEPALAWPDGHSPAGLDPRITFCEGGASRAESVLAALRRVPTAFEWVAIHDAARPLVSQDLISRVFSSAQAQRTAAVPAMPVTLTVKQARGPLPARVERTVPRQDLWTMQTPQVIRRDELLRAYETCPLPLPEVTDDTQLVELAGGEVWLVPGEARNLKITAASDLHLAHLWLADEIA